MVYKTSFNAHTKIWSGKKVNPIYNPEVSLGQIIHRTLQVNPNNVIQINHTENVSLTSNNVFKLSSRIALSLMKKNITQSDVVGIIATNTSTVMPLCFGCLFVGVPIHPLDVHFNKESIVHSWRKTKPKIIFAEGNMYNIVKEAVEVLQLNSLIFTLNDHLENVQSIDDLLTPNENDENTFQPVAIKSGNETAAIFCSSGTTGLPKAVCVSHRSLLENTLRFEDNVNDIILYFIPIFWGTSYLGLLNAGITGTTRLAFNQDFTPELGLHLIDQYQATKMFLPSPLIIQMCNSLDIQTKSIHSLKTIYCGGTRLSPETRKNIRQYLTPSCMIEYGYGCTEIGTIAVSRSDENPSSNGYLCDNVEVKIVSGEGESLRPFEDGEIYMRNGMPWNGYFGDLKSTLDIYDQEEMWCRTGDLGHFDDQGHLYVVDRIKDILKTRGFQFSANEVEDVIMEVEDVKEVFVVGLHDEILVDVPGALVVRKKGSNLKESDVEAYISAKTPFYKHVTERVFFVENLPRNSAGKVVRRLAKDICEKLYKEKLNLGK